MNIRFLVRSRNLITDTLYWQVPIQKKDKRSVSQTQGGHKRLFHFLITVQVIYYLITALWPIVHIESFMVVTGYKTDLWLVKTVGALLIPISLTLASYLLLETDIRPAVILGSTSAIAFATIDFYYFLRNVISDIYAVDGGVQLILLIMWIILIAKVYQSVKN